MTEQLLDAGAVLPGSGPRVPGVAVLTGRSYTHPALPSRTVVRLAGEPLGPAEDQSMEYLGFIAAGAVPVGHARVRALGFPDWVLVNDPARGGEALALVKDLERLARLAKSKPGNARDGYEAIARRLAATAPHFLPTFWEQAGRAYVAAENLRQAATCFGLARRAEREHGSAVDEDRLRDVHLEFALAGALTAKALTEYARDLRRRRPGGEVYRLVRDIAVRRVAGGLPPGAGFAGELRALAKAAGLDAAAEDEALLGDLLPLPAVAQAHAGFWKAYRPVLQRLARRDPDVPVRLLALLPAREDAQLCEQWLELLEAAGAVALLAAADGPDAASWLERFVQHRDSGYRHPLTRSPRLAALIERLAPRLRAAGRPLRLTPPLQSFRIDLDLLDACRAHGIAVEVDTDTLPVRQWAETVGDGRRDLAAVAADPTLLPALTRGTWELLGLFLGAEPLGRDRLRRLPLVLETAGLATALRDGLAVFAEQAQGTTLAGLETVTRSLAPLWSAQGVVVAPRDLRRLAALDMPEVLARTLRAGLVSELGWPAYETAATPLKRAEPTDSWPALVLTDQTRVVRVHPDGRSDEHTVQPPAGSAWHHRAIDGRDLDGRLLVTGAREDGERWGYWADSPHDVFPARAGERDWSGAPMPQLPFPGGVTTGGRPWSGGHEPHVYQVSSDGTTYWRNEREPHVPGQAHVWRWREYDPATGIGGRAGLPRFFEQDAPAGGRLIARWSWLRPAPEAFAGSPLGCADGLLGWRVFAFEDGTQLGQATDGRTVRWRPTVHSGDQYLVGALRLPGDERPRPVTARVISYPRAADLAVTVWDADGAHPVQQCTASHTRPPFTYWHGLRPRDERGSAALRAVTPELAAALLADVSGGVNARLDELIRVAIRRHLPELHDEVLRRAVRDAIRTTIRLRDHLATLAGLLDEHAPLRTPGMTAGGEPVDGSSAAPQDPAERLPAVGPSSAATAGTRGPEASLSMPEADAAGHGSITRTPAAPPDTTDRALADALGALVDWKSRYHYGAQEARTAVVGQLAALTRALSEAPGRSTGTTEEAAAGSVAMPNAESPWPKLLPGLGAVLTVAASPTTTPGRRAALARLLRAFADSPFAAPDPRLRFVELAVTDDYRYADEVHAGERRIVFLSGNRHRLTVDGRVQMSIRYAVDRCPEAAFAPIHGLEVRAAIHRAGWGDAARLRAAGDLLDGSGSDSGAAPWRPEAAVRLAELTGLTRAEAAVLLAGLPVGDEDEPALTPAQREALGVSAAHARLAVDRWRKVAHEHRIVLLDAAVPADPARLWTHGPDADAVAAAWVARFGRRTAITEELLIEADRVIPGGDGADVLRAIIDPEPDGWLHTDGASEAYEWHLATKAERGDSFDEKRLTAVAAALAWLAYRLPAGDPHRGRLAHALDLVRQRLANPRLAVGTAVHSRALVPDDLPGLWRSHDHGTRGAYHLLPAAITTPDAPALALGQPDVAAALRLLRDPALAAAIGGEEGPSPMAYLQDPRVSVPDLVAAVAAAHGLAAEAAAYYLQLLALPDPTDANAARWLGVTTARLKPLRAALVAAGLVVEARRERASRTVFLRGGWLNLKAPALPLESSKAPLLGLRLDTAPPLGTALLGRPVADLFRDAWAARAGA
ncbi:hypothetical protein AB0B66_04145 [Catellatospora sp. NPDC049111]|uniref:hypothetical protein n=1 Tax=Catellatospora sp. NPDC049111 TaxID=3155271 RepID=UPI0033D06B0D